MRNAFLFTLCAIGSTALTTLGHGTRLGRTCEVNEAVVKNTTDLTFEDRSGNTLTGTLTWSGRTWEFAGQLFLPEANAGSRVRLSGSCDGVPRLSEKDVSLWGEEQYAIAFAENNSGAFRVYFEDASSVSMTIDNQSVDALSAATGMIYTMTGGAPACNPSYETCLSNAQGTCGTTNGNSNVESFEYSCDPNTGATTCKFKRKGNNTGGGGEP
jgi:hypothetical protein